MPVTIPPALADHRQMAPMHLVGVSSTIFRAREGDGLVSAFRGLAPGKIFALGLGAASFTLAFATVLGTTGSVEVSLESERKKQCSRSKHPR